MEKWLNHQFESSTGTTEEFAQFAKEFKAYIKKNLPTGYTLAAFNRGHFYISGFIVNDETGKNAYFSTSDVRYFPGAWHDNILVRTAEHEKDYTGGMNQFSKLPGLVAATERLTTV
jgi:hypothetical protein